MNTEWFFLFFQIEAFKMFDHHSSQSLYKQDIT